MKATVRFYSIKTGELLRSKLVNVKLEGNRTVFDTPITIAPGEDINIQLHFTNPILRSHDPDAPSSAAFTATAESLGLNITEVGKPIIKYESTPSSDHGLLDPANRLRYVGLIKPIDQKNIVRCIGCGDSEVSDEDIEEWANGCSPPICPCCRGSAELISQSKE